MRRSGKVFILNMVRTVHLRLFGHPMGDTMERFIKGLGWVGLGSAGSFIFLFVTNLMAIRWLGPAEYGKYALIIALGQVLIIPMLMGLTTATIKFVASEKAKDKIISTSFYAVSFLIVLTAVILFSFRGWLSDTLRLDDRLFIFAVGYSGVLAFKYIWEAVLKGRHRFKTIGLFEIVGAFIIFIVFFSSVFLSGDRTFQPYVVATISGLLIYSLMSLYNNRLHLLARFDIRVLKKLFSYGGYAIIGSISGFVIGNIDRFFLNSYLGVSAVGLYFAYLGASSAISAQPLQVFINVFFPTAAGADDPRAIYQKLKQMIRLAFLPFFALNTIIIAILIKIYGPAYEFNLFYIVLFALQNVILTIQTILGWLICSFGVRGIRFVSLAGMTGAVINIILLVILIKQIGFVGAILASIMIYVFLTILALIYLNKGVKNEEID